MTRETKIGLLVGLAFIIVIGILLSDHLSTATEPPQAPITQVTDTVRRGVGVTTPTDQQPPITFVPPVQITPVQPVPTREDLHRPVAPPKPQVAIVPPTPAPVRPTSPDNALQQLIGQFPEDLTALNAHPELPPVQPQNSAPAPTPAPIVPPAPVPPAVASAREYKAEEGDSLSKIAKKFLNSGGKSACQAIVDANPSLKADPNKIIAGKTYVIPASFNPTSPTTPAAPTAPVAPQNPPAAPKPTRNAEYIYTVKAGDTLWRIATNQLGDGKAAIAIKELNKDVLKGSDTLRTGMKLRLPARPVASAN